MAGALGLHEGRDTSANERLHALFEAVTQIDDAAARERAAELVAALIDLYGSGLARIVQVLDELGSAAGPVRRLLAEDEVVASLLLIHGLYPMGRAGAHGDP